MFTCENPACGKQPHIRKQDIDGVELVEKEEQ
jgi:hypothetical protein